LVGSHVGSRKKIEPVLERLAGEPRILRKDTPPGKQTHYEIFHDVLATLSRVKWSPSK